MSKRERTKSPKALEEDFLGGDHGEPSSNILVHRIAELRPRSALNGALAKPSICELASASGGCDLNLIVIIVELVLNHLLDPVLIGIDQLSLASSFSRPKRDWRPRK